MSIDRKYMYCALIYAVVGMCLGIFMAASKNYIQQAAHTHVLLVGFVVSFVYGTIHKLWLEQANTALGKVRYVLYNAGTIAMSAGLFLLYGRFYPETILGPILGASSVAVLVAALLMLYMVIKSGARKSDYARQA